MTFDITDTLAPDSTQLDAVDLLGGAQTFTITDVSRGNAEQPVNVHLAEFPRVWRPGKSMRRVLAACWGNDAKQWIGRRVTLYCDESVKFGSEVVGGTRISHLSHIDKAKKVPLLVSRGKAATFTVQPLKEAPPAAQQRPSPSADDVATCTDTEQLRAMWQAASPDVRKLIEARVATLNAEPAADPTTGEVADEAAPWDEEGQA